MHNIMQTLKYIPTWSYAGEVESSASLSITCRMEGVWNKRNNTLEYVSSMNL